MESKRALCLKTANLRKILKRKKRYIFALIVSLNEIQTCFVQIVNTLLSLCMFGPRRVIQPLLKHAPLDFTWCQNLQAAHL